jgi:transcriptional regulator with XRE-family HTH domain
MQQAHRRTGRQNGVQVTHILTKADIGKRLRAAREAAGKTMRGAADDLDSSRVQLTRWECGYHEVNYTMLQRMCAAYGITVGDLFKVDPQ